MSGIMATFKVDRSGLVSPVPTPTNDEKNASVWIVSCGQFDDIAVAAVYASETAAKAHVERNGFTIGTAGRQEPYCVSERFEVSD